MDPARSFSRPRPFAPVFWFPAHVAFEIALIAALIVTWSQVPVRTWLLVALASHCVMRIWSAFDFISKALAHDHRSGGASMDPAKPAAIAARPRNRQCHGCGADIGGAGRVVIDQLCSRVRVPIIRTGKNIWMAPVGTEPIRTS